MQRTRIALGLGLFLVTAGSGAAQTPPGQPAAQKPLNPTQEIAKEQAEGPAIEVGPAKIRIGGYVGLHGIYPSTNSGGGLGTGFGSIPYADTVQGNVSETRLSAQASRLSIRVDADFPEGPRFRRLSGYFEMDFAGSTPGNVAVTASGADLRLRLAFAEVQYGQSFFLAAGQAFSLMTAPKDQLSLWPADVELTQAVDLNYVAGMVWDRSPQVRLTWRPSKRFNWAVSVENPEQQLGSGVVTRPVSFGRRGFAPAPGWPARSSGTTRLPAERIGQHVESKYVLVVIDRRERRPAAAVVGRLRDRTFLDRAHSPVLLGRHPLVEAEHAQGRLMRVQLRIAVPPFRGSTRSFPGRHRVARSDRSTSLESAEATLPRRSTVERRSPRTSRPEQTAVRRGRWHRGRRWLPRGRATDDVALLLGGSPDSATRGEARPARYPRRVEGAEYAIAVDEQLTTMAASDLVERLFVTSTNGRSQRCRLD